ncbi:hypothetical protein AB5N19_00153 [Seiridium cardinale]
MPQYKFVTVEGGDGQPSRLTKSIRSHAIRAGLQKATYPSRAKATAQKKVRGELVFHPELYGTRSTSGERAKPDIVPDESTVTEYRHTDPGLVSRSFAEVGMVVPRTFCRISKLMVLPPQCSTRLQPKRIEAVFAGSVDPFNSLPITTNSEVDYLVRYFLIKFDLTVATVDRRRSWFPYALQSAPMMHSTLAMTAALWRAEYAGLEHSIQLEGIRQKGKAMQEIRARLAHADSVSSDGEMAFLMSTMSTLVLVEICDSDFEAAETHLRGVRTLFSSRGGRDRFKDEFVLFKSINLADIQVATALGHPPIFPLLHIDETDLPATIINEAHHPPLDQSVTNDISYTTVRIFTQLRQLLLARQSSMVSLEGLRMLFNVVDDAILQHLYRDCIPGSDPTRRSTH